MIVFSLTFLFAAIGLVVDLGYAYYLKARVQTAADAAASAAAVYAKYNGDNCSGGTSCGTDYTCAGVSPATTSLEAGCLYVTTDGPPSFTAHMVENNTAPPGVTGNTPSLWFQATVTTTAPNFFLYGAGYQTATISGQAIAGVTRGPCVYVLSSNASPALSLSGSSTLTTTGCGISVNSSAHPAVSVTGASSISTTSLTVNGTTQITGSSTVSPSPKAGTVTDPFGTLTGPSIPSCSGQPSNYSLSNNATATISPGVYCGGITVSSATLTLSPGVYILNGGGLTVWNNAVLNASGVMFYNTGVNGQIAGPITISGGAVVNQSAPSSGPYQGIAFFQDRSITYAASNSISNGATGNITGTFYFPTTDFQFQGNTDSAVYAAFIANTITISGNSSLKSDPTGAYTGLPKTNVSLIQ
jgi:hypothetical protein